MVIPNCDYSNVNDTLRSVCEKRIRTGDSIESLAFVHSVLCETRFRRYFCYWNYSSVFCRCRISVVFLLLGSIENRKAKSLFVSREPIPMGNWLWLGYESTVCWQCRD